MWYCRSVFFNLHRFRSPLPSIAAFPLTLLWMNASCDNNHSTHLKALVFLCAFEESVDCHLLSSFCEDLNLHISLFKYLLSTMRVSKESISKFLIRNRFHVKLGILSPYSNRIYLKQRFAACAYVRADRSELTSFRQLRQRESRVRFVVHREVEISLE